MKIKKKAICKLFLCFALAFSLLGATFSWLNVKNAKASDIATMDGKISVTYSADYEWFQVDFDGFTVDYNSWHDASSDVISANNGVDPLEYTYLNGTSLRTLYSETEFCEVYTDTDWIEAYYIYLPDDNYEDYTLQLKAGFTLVGTDGVAYVLENDTAVYGWTDGTFGEITVEQGPSEVDVTDTVEIGFALWGEHESQFKIFINCASELTTNAWWNISDMSANLISANNGVDIMNYIYINDQNIRELSDDNRENNTYPLGNGTGWFENSDQCRPVFVESTSEGIWVRVLHSFSEENFIVTLKAGFKVLNSDGDVSVISEDVNFSCNGTTGYVSEAQSYTLSFDGIDDTLTVVGGLAIGELPEVPAKAGGVGVWTIDGEKITAETLYNYGEDKTAKAVYTIDVTDTVEIGFALWGEHESQFKIFINCASELTTNAWWNISDMSASLISANNGVDIMNYIYINDQNIRELSDDNRENNTYPLGNGTGWFTNSDQCRPVFVESNSEGIWVRVLHSFSEENFTVTLKAGFEVLNSDGDVSVISEDVNFSCNGTTGCATKMQPYTLSFDGIDDTLTVVGGLAIGELPEVPAKAGGVGVWTIDGEKITAETLYNYGENKTAKAVYTIDVTDTVVIEFSYKSEHESQFKIFINCASELSNNAWWNISDMSASLISANNGVDIMNYIYINDQNIRELSDDNREDNTYPLGNGTGWFTNSDQCRPVFVESTSEGIWVRVLHSFSEENFTVTLKTGFEVLNSDGDVSVISEDVSFVCDGTTGQVSRIQEYTLSFEGINDTLTVVGGLAIGELPEVPEQAGYIGVWTIDGVEISAETKYMYDGNKTAVAVYEKDLSLLAKVDIKDSIFLGDWGVPSSETDLRYLWINDYQGLPTSLYKSYWNDNGEYNADKNGGVDIMDYIYIDGVSLRTLVKLNQQGETSYVGTTSPLSYGGVFAPVVVITDASGIAIKVLTNFKVEFVLTVKAGFSVVSGEVIYYLSEDVNFKVFEKQDALAQGRAHTLSFESSEGEVDSIIVAENVAIYNLPSVPEKQGLVGRWTIDGVPVTAETVFAFNCDKIAVAQYYQKYYSLSFEGVEIDPITVEFEAPMANLPTIPSKDGYIAYWTIDGEEVDSTTVFNFTEDKVVVANYLQIMDIADVLLAEDWGTVGGAYEDLTYIRIGISQDANGNLILPNAFENVFWNDDVDRKANANFGCDIMSYIYINGYSVRDIVSANANGTTSYVGTTFPFNVGSVYAPVVVVTSGNEVFIYVLKDFAGQGEFTLTFKAGFTLRASDNLKSVYVLSQDVEFYYETVQNATLFGRDFTLTFEGSGEERELFLGDALGELPDITQKAGYTAVWTINGDEITADTLFVYNANVTAVVKYTAIDYTITIQRANGEVETLTFNDLNKDEILASITLTESDLFYAYSWQEALPSVLEYKDYTFVEISSEQPASTRIISYSLTVGVEFTMNLYVEVVGEIPQMKFVMGNEEIIVNGTLVDETLGIYVYKFAGIEAYNLAEEFIASVLVGENSVDCVTYSVESYLNELANGDISDSLKVLIADIVAYGKASANYVGKATSIRDIDGLTATEYVDLTETDSNKTVSTDSSVAITRAFVNYDGNSNINVVFRADNAENVTIKINGKVVDFVEVEEGSGVYVVSSDDLYVTNADVKYTFEIFVGEERVQTLVYNLKSYVYEIQGDDGDAMAKLLKAIYNLSLSVKSYKA